VTAEVRSLERKRRRRKLLVVLRSVFLIGAAGGLVYLFYFSTTLTVKSVTIVGNYYAQASEIESAANISKGVQLARLDSDVIREHILHLAEIKAVEVRRAWPNEVILAVVERKPIAVTKVDNNWKYVSADGTVFGKSTAQPDGFVGVSASSSKTFSVAAKVAAGLPFWLRERVTSLRGITRDNVVITLDDGVEIRWGGSSQGSLKAQVLKALLGQRARIYDISVPDRPSITP